MDIPVDRAWLSGYGGIGGTVIDTILVDHYYGPPVKTTQSTYTARGSRSRSSVGNAIFLDGWRYSRAYTARIVRQESTALAEWWDNSRFQNFTRPRYVNEPSFVGAIALTSSPFKGAADRSASASATRALTKLNQEKVQLGTAILESRKTIDHLASTFIRVWEMYRNLRKGRFGAVAEELGLSLSKRHTRKLASNWLEYKYAWMPLYADLHAAFDIAQDGLSKALTVKTVSDISEPVDARFNYYTWRTYDSTRKQGTYVYRSSKAKVGCKTIIHAKIDDQTISGLKQLGMVNPISVAWELVPYSFVVDWILPVGNFLEACSAPLGLTFMDGCVTRYLYASETLPDVGGTHIATTSKPLSEGSIKWQIFEMSRARMLSFPVPTLAFSNHLATEKVVTATALWRQRLR